MLTIIIILEVDDPPFTSLISFRLSIDSCFYFLVAYTLFVFFGIGATSQETTNWGNLLGCDAGFLPFDYLGASVGANMNLIKNWKPIIKKSLTESQDQLSHGIGSLAP